MVSRTSLVVWLCAAVLICTSPAPAQSPIINPDFLDGMTGWTPYTYIPWPGTDGVEPFVGTYTDFYLLPPFEVPEITKMCGIQQYATTGNGGVCQSFTWTGGPAVISAWGRAYAADYDDEPYDNGVQVRMGLAEYETTDRNWVAEWQIFPWNQLWATRTVLVPGPGTYTLFLEGYQPNADAYMSTVWSNVDMWEQTPITITSGPTIAPHPTQPETKAIVTWTTDIPSASEVEYGYTSGYGSVVRDEALVTNHSVTLTALVRSKEYHYRAKSTAYAYIEAVSADAIYHTPIWITDVSAAITGEDAVTVSWTTNVPTQSQVEYWPEAIGAHVYTNDDYTLVTNHQTQVTGLKKGVYYCFRAWSKGAGYTNTSAPVQTLVILPPVGTSLANPSFDEGPIPDIPSLYPWVQYTAASPGFNPIDGIIGIYPKGTGQTWSVAAIQAYNGGCFVGSEAYWGYKNGGVFQRVAVAPGQYYALNARYITQRIGGQDGYNLVRIGIDPDGGTDPTSTSIKWWSGRSATNDNQWQLAGVTAMAGTGGVATVFLEFYQRYAIEEHVAAIDSVTFGQPQITSVGALRSSAGNLGAILQNKIVTYVAPVTFGTDQYLRAYVQEDNRAAGIAVLFPLGSPDMPSAGNKLTVTGVLSVFGREAAVMAETWSVDTNTYPLPTPLGISQASIGTASLNQPPLLGRILGLCSIGLRVRMYGRVTSAEADLEDTLAYIDDGSKIADSSGHPGVLVRLPAKEGTTVVPDDKVDVTGVLSIKLVDPDGWPDPTDYYTYTLLCASPDDWAVRN